MQEIQIWQMKENGLRYGILQMATVRRGIGFSGTILVAALALFQAHADDFAVSSFTSDGALSLANAFTNGVVTIERAQSPLGPWTPDLNIFSLCSVTQVNLARTGMAGFFRPLAVDVSGQAGFTNLAQSYGLLSTVAGAGLTYCATCSNNWQPSFEGGPATNAELSAPHIAMADRAGNIYIADKDAQAIRKVTPDGNIFTVAGTGAKGAGTTAPAPATSVDLYNPNGLYVQADGTFYIVDRDNGLIRKVDTNGIMTLMVDNGGPITGGRGLWVSPDESILYYASGLNQTGFIMSWDSTNGLQVFSRGASDVSAGFGLLGQIVVDPNGSLVVADLQSSRVFRVAPDGTATLIAGNGGPSGGGDGFLATQTGLNGVRAVWFLPTGGYFLGTDVGQQVWYVDTDGYIHLWLNGGNDAHVGDGAWFYDPATPKVGHVRAITMDYSGNLLIAAGLNNYVRKVSFLRLQP